MGDVFTLLASGLAQSFEPLNLFMIVVGCLAGLFIGAMPGLGSVNGVAILLPVTFLVPPTAAIIFLAALYYGAMYGGAISSITLGIPGASTAVATVFDGRPMAQAGKADQALSAAAVASFIGGTISVVLFTFFAPPLAIFALKFGPPEFFTLMVFSLTIIAGVSGDDLLKGLGSACLGLGLATIGLDLVYGSNRFIFGEYQLMSGLNFIPVLIGLFALPEIIAYFGRTEVV